MKEANGEDASTRSTLYAYYVLGVLVLVNIVNFIDRQLPFILAESIKADLDLSDAQLGLLGGLLFTVVYSVGGMVLARAADRTSPRLVISASLFFWSVATSLAGFAQNFWQLASSRLCVALGESGVTPASHSLLSRYFPPRRRGRAIAIYSLGIPAGFMLGLWLGGWVSEVANWRTAFIIIGLPGIVLSLIFITTVRDVGEPDANTPRHSLFGGMKVLFDIPCYRQILFGITLYGFGTHTIVVFMPAYFIRTHGLTVSQTGLWLGLIYGVFGVAGTLLGGYLADRAWGGDHRWRLWIPAIGLVAAAPFLLGVLNSPYAVLALALFAVPKFCSLIFFAPTFSAAQNIAPGDVRAMTAAMLLFAMSIGNSIGPFVIGVISDALSPRFGDDSLRYALCVTAISQVWAAFHFFRAGVLLPSAEVE